MYELILPYITQSS